MRFAALVVALAALLALAGCSALPAGPDGPGPSRSPSEGAAEGRPTPANAATPAGHTDATATTVADGGATGTVDGTGTAEPTPTATPVRDDAADNPWGEATVSVALRTNGHAETDYRAALRGALSYWNEHTRYGTYPVTFEYTTATDGADVLVEVRDSVGACGYEESERFLGCAPLVNDSVAPDRPATVRVEAGYDRASTRRILIHEFGHVLGIRHGEPPEEYMAANDTAYTVDRPNATERGYPWETTRFEFHVATGDLPPGERAATRDQVQHVIDYYDRVAARDDDVPSNVTLAWAANRSDANVYVSFPSDLPCGQDTGSCGQRVGVDPDGDGAIEYYRRLDVTMAGIETDARGWHVGYWFGTVLVGDEGDLPAPFRDASYRERRGDWWTDAP